MRLRPSRLRARPAHGLLPLIRETPGDPTVDHRRLDDERTPDDYAGDQPQGPGPDDDDRIRRGPGAARDAERRGGARRGYFRWPLESAAATPRPM